MADWFGDLEKLLSVIANSKAIIGTGLVLLSATGTVPRVGLGRALTLGLRSYFKTTTPLSVRKSEVQLLSESMQTMERGSYIAVIGGKGNGKSCLIDTAVHRHFGVVKFSTKSGADKDLIVDQALREIAGFRFPFSYLQPAYSARRVLFFYSMIFRRSPIVVISVPERLKNHDYADTPSAVRALADDFGLRVIVDGSPNSIPPELLTTRRQTVLVVEPMSRDQIESIPEFQSLFAVLKAHKLDGPVWDVQGGSPVDYLKLKEAISKYLSLPLPLSTTASNKVVDQVKDILLTILSDALNKHISKSSKITKAIIKVFRDSKVNKIPATELEGMDLSLNYPNKVFREVTLAGRCFVVPARPAVSLLITENIENDDGVLNLLEKLFQETKKY